MAVSDVITAKLLNRWSVRMIESDWHFNQVTGSGSGAPLAAPCSQVYVQSERDELATALYRAVKDAASYLHFAPRPTWQTKDIELSGRFPPAGLCIQLTGYLVAFGRRATTLIDADAAVVYSDTDGDNVDDMGTITVNTSVTDPDEIQVFFRVADGAPGAADERWEIEPISVSITGGVATIQIRRWLLAHPTVLWAKPYNAPNYNDRHAGDTGDPNDFVTAVDVYRVYNDSANAITFRAPSCNGCSDSVPHTADACGDIIHAREGRARIVPQSSACFALSKPITVEVAYLAGHPLVNGLMERELEETIIRLANCKMPQQPGNFCDRTLTMWQRDVLPVPAERLNVRDVNNPLGIREGEINAWKVFSDRALGRAGVNV